MKVRFANYRTKPRIFQFDDGLIAEAMRRHSDVAARVNVSIDHDLEDLEGLKTADVLVTSNDVVRDPRFPRERLAEYAPSLRWIHLIGAGLEPLLPLSWLPPKVTLTNNSGVHVRKTREFAQMALLMLNARVPQILTNQREARWQQVFTPSIEGKTLAVIGVGDMGGAAANRGKRLGLHVLGVRREVRPHDDVDEMFPTSELMSVLPRADFVYVSVPLTPATRFLIGKAQLDAMKRDASLVNVSRAGVIDYDVLREKLIAGELAGAILDVFDPEPLPSSSPLWSTPNLIVSPHVSSDDVDTYMALTLDLVCENLARLLAGKPLANQVDPSRGY
ncbi:MAG: D-2-hydroxyacid dehydrogenase [Vulcanimicrobiaceae bacterium]